MPTNTRVYWPTQAVGIAPFGSPTSYTAVRGVQSVGHGGRSAVEYLHEMGRLPTYDTFEDIPEVELTVEKVLDGYPPAYVLATQGAASADLAGRATQRCHVAMSVHRDHLSAATGGQVSQATCSGMYANSVEYSFGAGPAPLRETFGLVGNNIAWTTGSFTFTGMTSGMGVSSAVPAAAEGVNLGQHLLMTTSRFPTDIPGISSSGTNNEVVVDNTLQFSTSFQSARVSASFGRTGKRELGRRGVYVRHMEHPVVVTTTFEFPSKDGTLVNLLEDGPQAGGENTTNQTIKLYAQEGLALDLGTRNRRTDVTTSGGQAGSQGDVMISVTYSNHDELVVQHPADPTVALRP